MDTDTVSNESISSVGEPKPRRWSRTIRWAPETLGLVAIISGVVVLHIVVPGPIPSGGDGGNWLALAAERFGHGVMSAEVAYLPLYPVFLGAVDAVVGNHIASLVTTALVAKLALVLSVYVCARPLGRVYAVVAAVVVATGGALLEAYSWGGYTQLLGMGLGFVATFLIIGYLNTGVTSHLVWGIVLCAATLLTHTMIGAMLGGALVLAVFHHLYMTDPRQRERARNFKTGMAVAIPVVGVSAIIYFTGSASGFSPTINPSDLSRLDAVLASVRDAPYPWAVIALAGLAVLAFRYWPEHVAVTIAVASAWTAVGLGLFLATGEPRALLVAQVGFVLLAMVAFGALRETLSTSTGRRQKTHGRPRKTGSRMLLIFGFALVAAVSVGGIDSYSVATDWFRVVDRAEIDALDRLAGVSEDDALVMAARGHHGNPVGWWVEGYAERSTYTGIDPSFLAFPDEVEQAEFANDFFSRRMSSQISRSRLDALGVDYLVVDRRGPDARWLETDFARELAVVDDSSNIVVLKAP